MTPKTLKIEREKFEAWFLNHHFNERLGRQGNGDWQARNAWEIWQAAIGNREWKGLTEEEAAECQATTARETWARIEAKLKEKNK